MRGLWLVAAAFLVPLAAGQGYVVEDRVGDGQVLVGSAGGVENPTDNNVDILALRVDENETGFLFTVDFQAPPATPEIFLGSTPIFIDVGFRHNDQRYVVRLPPPGQDLPGPVGLLRIDAAGGERIVSYLDTFVLPSQTERVFQAFVPRSDIYDTSATVPGVGSVFADFHVHATGSSGRVVTESFYTFDTLPDEGTPVPVYLGRFGLFQGGSARLSSLAPMRASNGEASTFVFSVTATNVGSAPAAYAIGWEAVPGGWGVRLDGDRFLLQPGQSVDRYLIVTTPFGHEHGGADTIRLRMTSADDPLALGQIDLGIRYHTVAQPAGHHDRIYFHSHPLTEPFPGMFTAYGSPSGLYVNTIEQDEEDSGESMRAESYFRPIENFTWIGRLEPSLAIGLDVDPALSAVLNAAFSSQVPVQGAVVHASLFVRPLQAERVVLAEGVSPPFDMQAGTPVPLQLLMPAVGQKLPFQDGSEMYVELRMETGRPTAVTGAEVPVLEPGGWLQLPLVEYRDPLPIGSMQTLDFSLEAITPVQRAGNPGDRFLHEARLTNHGAEERTFDLQVSGVNAAWTVLRSPANLTLARGENAVIQLVTTIPNDAAKLDLSDVVVIASSGDAGSQALVRFLTTTDLVNDRDDDSELITDLAPEAKASPGLSLLVVLALLAAVALSRRG